MHPLAAYQVQGPCSADLSARPREVTHQCDLQEEALKLHRPLVVVGTPGRLAELSRAGALLTHHTGGP